MRFVRAPAKYCKKIENPVRQKFKWENWFRGGGVRYSIVFGGALGSPLPPSEKQKKLWPAALPEMGKTTHTQK